MEEFVYFIYNLLKMFAESLQIGKNDDENVIGLVSLNGLRINS